MKVVGWSGFQHYLKRRPPWIKLHRTLLDNPDFMRLPLASKALAPLVWLLASESEDPGKLPPVDDIAWRLRMEASEVKVALRHLVSGGFIEDASGVLAECLQDATLERERETEGETEERERESARNVTVTLVTTATATDSLDATELSEIDAIDDDLAVEERRFLSLCGDLRSAGDDIQKVIDGLPRPPTRSPFNASRMLKTGRSGVPRTPGGVTVLRLTNDALEARQRAQDAPILSDNNRRTFDAIDRVAARLIAKRDGKPVPKEIEG